MPITPNPRPPCCTGSDKYGGSQVNNPHQANIAKKLKSSRANVCRTYGALKITAKPPPVSGAPLLPAFGRKLALSQSKGGDFPSRRKPDPSWPFHISDSGTRR